MGYQALKKIRLGDRDYRKGETVPDEPPRNWRTLIRHGLVVEITPGKGAKAAKADEVIKALEAERDALRKRIVELDQERAAAGTPGGETVDVEQLAKLKRAELDAMAAEAGVEEPGKLPSKDAVIAEIVAKHAEA